MHVKSAFLNDFIKEEFYVEQPPNFVDPKFSNHVFKLNKENIGLRDTGVNKTNDPKSLK